jgi:glycosyltransferase involved in cell wall biosynthesis
MRGRTTGSGPTVSVGLPVYNGDRYLAETLDALLGQTFEDFELVVGDNGSTDATTEICLRAAARDPRVRLLRSDENRGAAWNYNRVFHESTGRYFRWAAHDDLVAPTYLERVVEALDDAPETVVAAHTRTLFIDEHGNDAGVGDDDIDLTSEDPARRLGSLVRHLVKSNILFALVRRDALATTRLHGAYPSADYVLLAELALRGSTTIVPERLFLRRVHPDMSRVALTNLHDVAEWFEPGSGKTARPEELRLFVEHLRAIRQAPIGAAARTRVATVFLPLWVARHKRAMGAEAWQVTAGRLRLQRG